MQWHGKSHRKQTGGKLKSSRKKRKYEFGTDPMFAEIGDDKITSKRIRGGDSKSKVIFGRQVNITDPKTGETKKGEITDVLENTANPHYVRRDIITKGCVIETNLGKALVSSRPGQDGCLNAILLEDKKDEK